MSTIRFDFGDVVLVPFPFTSQATSKKRPAVVVSNQAYNAAKPDVLRNNKYLPFVRHPSQQFEDWYLLPFVTGDGDEWKVDPTYSRVFLNYLRAWMQD